MGEAVGPQHPLRSKWNLNRRIQILLDQLLLNQSQEDRYNEDRSILYSPTEIAASLCWQEAVLWQFFIDEEHANRIKRGMREYGSRLGPSVEEPMLGVVRAVNVYPFTRLTDRW